MATATTPIWAQGETFYVPHFEVKIANQQLDPMVVQDIMQVTFKDKVGELDSVEITLNNWDAQLMKPKYEPPSAPKYDGLFDPGKPIRVVMGYAGNTKNDRVMLSGEITTIAPVFPESGPLTMSVGALSNLAKFKKKQHTWSWSDKSPNKPAEGWRDTDIAREICANKVTDNQPGLDVVFDGNPSYKSAEPPHPYVAMNNEFDILFLLDRAHRNGYSLFLGVDPQSGKDMLSFKPSDQIKNVTYELAWGASLIDFRPSLTTAHQVKKVTVHSWDHKAGKPITVSSVFDEIGINQDLRKIANLIEGREEVIVDQPVYSVSEAQDFARSALRNQLQEMVEASGSTVGLPDLRAGRRVVIKNLGPTFSGAYFVTETTHTIGDGGYRTNFSCRREGPEPGAAV
jgi:phage protein D